MDSSKVVEFVEENISNGVIPALVEFVKIPSLSTDYDKDWETNGYMEQAMNVLINYVNSLQIEGFTYKILKEPGKPWLYFGTLEATDPSLGTILMYGHFDKQPHLSEWSEGLGPTTPVIRGDRIYGRGVADDGYAIPTSGLIIKALQVFNIPHGKIVILGENDEESSSASLVYYIEKLKPRIGKPEVIVCLDSGLLTYDRLWLTTSLRGSLTVDLTVQTLKIGLHSGSGSGIIPSTFRVLEQLISRIEDKETGRILIKELHTDIEPRHHIEKGKMMMVIGDNLVKCFPFEDGVEPISSDLTELAINNALMPSLVVTGFEGLPPIANAGNVLHPKITARLSFRVPPGVDSRAALDVVVKELTRDPPYNSKVTVNCGSSENGWEQKPIKPWLDEALSKASKSYFDNDYLTMGIGVTIPFMGFLGELFPDAQFIITGVLGVDSNAHSIDENLNIPYLKKCVCCLIDTFASLGIKHN